MVKSLLDFTFQVFIFIQHFVILGRALSVAPWFLERYPHIFSENERVVLNGNWKHGFYSLTAVSAFNVANIKLTFDEEVHTNGLYQSRKLSDYLPYEPPKSGYKGADEKLTRHGFFREYEKPIEVKRGDEIARFELGSTVVVVVYLFNFAFF